MRQLKEVALTVDEYEALRLADLMGLSHEAAGKHMGVSRATFGRIVQKARKSVADALVNGMAIRIEGGEYQTVDGGGVKLICDKCQTEWTSGNPVSNIPECPACREKAEPLPE